MKRTLWILLALSLCLSLCLCACGDKTPATDAPDVSDSADPADPTVPTVPEEPAVPEEPTTPAEPAAPATCTLTLSFDKAMVRVTADRQGDTFEIGTPITLTIAAETDYEITGVSVNGKAAALTGDKLALTLLADTEVRVTAKAIPPEPIQVSSADGCVIRVSNLTPARGEEVTVTASVTDFSHIPTIVVNGDKNHVLYLNIGENNTYTGSFIADGKAMTLSMRCTDYDAKGVREHDSTLAARRDTVVSAGEAMVTTVFRFGDSTGNNLNFNGFKISGSALPTASYSGGKRHLAAEHRGMPYAGGSNSLRGFIAACCNEDYGTTDKYTIKDNVLFAQNTAGTANYWANVYGANCADLVYWAWASVSNTINFFDTRSMVEANGVYKVGDYTYDTRYITVNQHSTLGFEALKDTVTDCKQNGRDVMFAAYAQLQPGDAIVWYYGETEAGHAMLVTEVDVARQKLYYCDLNGGTADRGGMSSHGCVGTEGVLTFEKMYQKGALPMTCKELLTADDPLESFTVIDDMADATFNLDNMLSGTLKSSYFISHVEIEIKDAKGNMVQSAIRTTADQCNSTHYTKYDMAYIYWPEKFGIAAPVTAADVTHRVFFMPLFESEFNWVWSQMDDDAHKVYVKHFDGNTAQKDNNVIDRSKLESGIYTCTVTAYDANGTAHVVRNFSFTK